MHTAHRAAGLAAVVSLGMAAAASAAVSLTTANYSENFDGLPSTGTTSLNNTIGFVNPLPGVTFDGTRFFGTGQNFDLIANSGTSTTGALHSYGATGSSERALGTLASGTTVPAFGVAITNNTGFEITSLDLDAFREQWRSSTIAANTIEAEYAIDGPGGSVTVSNYLTIATGYTALNDLDLVGQAPVTTNGALNGNVAPNRAAIGTILNVSIQPGDTLFLRWIDGNDSGNDAGLAIDDFSLVATLNIPEPASLSLLALGGLAALRRRRA